MCEIILTPENQKFKSPEAWVRCPELRVPRDQSPERQKSSAECHQRLKFRPVLCSYVISQSIFINTSLALIQAWIESNVFPKSGMRGFSLNKPNGMAVLTKNQTKEVEMEDRPKIRQKLWLGSNNCCIKYLVVFYAVNTIFHTLCGFIHFSQRLQLLIATS